MANNAGNGEMRLILNDIPDIKSTIINLQRQMYIMQPVMFDKCVLQTDSHIFPDCKREQQQCINLEAARIMTERDIISNDDNNNNNNNNNKTVDIKPRVSRTMNDIRRACTEYEKLKGYMPSDTQSFLTYCKKKKNIKKANWSFCTEVIYETDIKNKKYLWNKLNTDYNKYNASDSKENCESLQNILKKLKEFAIDQQSECINGLLQNEYSNIIIINFLSCLEIKDDIIRECVLMILQSLYDVSDDNFISFTNNNNIIEYLSKSLMLNQNAVDVNDSSARIEMKILQLLAVNFTGKELLYHTVFNQIKECIMSPYQHIDFIEYALQVILTIIEDEKCETAKKWINRDCKNDINIDHTTQFAVYVIETYPDTQSDQLSRSILEALYIDIDKALIEFGTINDQNDNEQQQVQNVKSSPIQIMASTTKTIKDVPNIMVNMQYSPYSNMSSSPYNNMSSSPYNNMSSSPYNNQYVACSSPYGSLSNMSHSPYMSSPYQQQYAAYYQQQQYAAYYQQQQQQQQQRQQQQYRYNSTNLYVNTPNQYNAMQMSPYSHQSHENQSYPSYDTYQNNQQQQLSPMNIKPKMNNSNKLQLPQLECPNLRRMSSDAPIQDKLHSTLAELLLKGSVMRKYPSIHTDITNYLQEIHKKQCKYKLVRMSKDWKYIEFYNISQQTMKTKGKPKILPIENILYLKSSFNDNQKSDQHSQDLLIYALDKRGNEIMFKLICQSRMDTKRWSIAINQIVQHFKEYNH